MPETKARRPAREIESKSRCVLSVCRKETILLLLQTIANAQLKGGGSLQPSLPCTQRRDWLLIHRKEERERRASPQSRLPLEQSKPNIERESVAALFAWRNLCEEREGRADHFEQRGLGGLSIE